SLLDGLMPVEVEASAHGAMAGPLIGCGLRHPNARVRGRAAAQVGRHRAVADHLGPLVRRYFEPGARAAVRAALDPFRPALPTLQRQWVNALCQELPAEEALRQALLDAAVPLPGQVRALFAGLCERRLGWRLRLRGGRARTAVGPVDSREEAAE